MNQYIAYCGLNCEACEARLATIHNDDERRAKVARMWSEWNGVEIAPEMVCCEGCRTEGRKAAYCGMCAIRLCATAKGYNTCGDCAEAGTCPKVAPIADTNAEAAANIGRKAD